ncbi:aminotransferase [Caldovatus aquaticus]|uniref:aspartate transaminase n=1 Tax=Caldovatus aquaticus TaxID=2865671 RepID=A0ABS7F2Y0_9PROT|nr:aminotransferase [Caldovatus aquaticus]MBW8269966.1 aminotransferase [Caldovatus aquaticus]
MDLPLSPRIRATDAPPIPAARAWAARYAGAAGPLLDLTQAVPGYPPHPDLLLRLAAAAGDRASAGYGPIDGEPALREALAADIARTYAAPVTAADVAITAGGNLAFTMAMAVLAGEGEAVLLPTPWYFNHRMALSLLGIAAIPLPCRAEDGFLPDPGRAAALLREAPRVRAVVLVTPNNPTGAAYPPEVIARFAALCRDHRAWLVLDETYRDFLPEPAGPPHGLFAEAGWREEGGVVQLYSFSKAYCVPGHRVGAILAGPAFRGALMKALDTMQICAPRAAQAALAWAVEGLRGWRAGNRALMAERAAAFRRAVAALPGWRPDALGAYFAYLRLPEGAPDALEAAERLAVEGGLLALPGPFFGPGQERHLRLAFANAGLEAIAAVPARLLRALPGSAASDPVA